MLLCRSFFKNHLVVIILCCFRLVFSFSAFSKVFYPDTQRFSIYRRYVIRFQHRANHHSHQPRSSSSSPSHLLSSLSGDDENSRTSNTAAATVKEVPEYKRKLIRIWNETKEFLSNLESVHFRRKFLLDTKYIISSAVKNISEGEIGKRGEEFVLIQFGIMALVFLGVPPLVSVVIKLCGVFSTICGLYLMIRGIWDLKENLTPFVSPIAGNQLVTSGVYDAVRHPIYTGLIFFCAGIAIASDSIEKAVLTAVLMYFLDRKANREEQMLLDLHPLTYSIYMQQTKKMFPSLTVT